MAQGGILCIYVYKRICIIEEQDAVLSGVETMTGTSLENIYNMQSGSSMPLDVTNGQIKVGGKPLNFNKYSAPDPKKKSPFTFCLSHALAIHYKVFGLYMNLLKNAASGAIKNSTQFIEKTGRENWVQMW